LNSTEKFNSSNPNNIESEIGYVQSDLAVNATTWTLPRVRRKWGERFPSGVDLIPVTRLASDCLTFPQEQSRRKCARERTSKLEIFSYEHLHTSKGTRARITLFVS